MVHPFFGYALDQGFNQDIQYGGQDKACRDGARNRIQRIPHGIASLIERWKKDEPL